ncbi:hypothetical protein [Alicyclobacillus ferrooxydans]|uniref:hypothetical protein n=1 Tax=Alicyclobacillus ferrooxydans TaxID=471514 RepID=UPI0006D57C39|nr:hypothetical protein [Alicyclobacillus ferrooxydans]
MAQPSKVRKRPGTQVKSAGPGTSRRPKRPAKRPAKASGGSSGLPSKTNASSSGSKNSLSKLLSPENIQETIKSVGSLRTQVKKWMTYLQQADQVLDTVFVTTNSLRETGVLDKLIKQRGKNLSTEDFTNILVALMNSPAGSQILKGMGGGSDDSDNVEQVEAPANQQALIEGQPAAAQRNPQPRRQQPPRQQAQRRPARQQPAGRPAGRAGFPG